MIHKLIFAMMLLVAVPVRAEKARILEQKEGSITFAVDENLKWRTVSHLLGDSLLLQDSSLVSASYSNIPLILDDIPFFHGMVRAFGEHRSVTLSPDVIWMLICQNCMHDFPDKISQMTMAGFSTTGPAERKASEVMLKGKPLKGSKDVVQYIHCGIPSITLTGTVQDWQKILDDTERMESLGAGMWASDLKPILEQFILAAQGNPDKGFWKNIVMKARPLSLSDGRDCSHTGILDGWFLKFMPYDLNGNPMPDLVSVSFKGYPRQMASIRQDDAYLSGGIAGYLDDDEKYGIRFVVGWDVRKADALAGSYLDRLVHDNFHYGHNNGLPLIVLDGVIVDYNIDGISDFDWQNDLYDKKKVAKLIGTTRKIKKIEVLKDADTKGVLEVWTKKPSDKERARTVPVIATSPYSRLMHLR